jgi:kinesin family protein C2/C3
VLIPQVDLAGSERVAKSGASERGLKEALAINKSLSALGDVIGALRRNGLRRRSTAAAFNAAAAAVATSTQQTSPSSYSSSPSLPSSEHVPFRNSKLTFLLAGSLGGSSDSGSRAVLFANVSPSRGNAEETQSSLNFAQRCRSVLLD